MDVHDTYQLKLRLTGMTWVRFRQHYRSLEHMIHMHINPFTQNHTNVISHSNPYTNASGIAVNPDCVHRFEELKLHMTSKYIIYKLSPTDDEIIVEKTSTSTDYNTFLADLPEDECRWAIYDFVYDLENDSKRRKLVFFSWAPDDANIEQKLKSASSQEGLKRQLFGVQVNAIGTSTEEISWEAVLEKAKRGN